MNLLAQVQQLEFAAGVTERRVATHQFSYTGAIDIVDLSKVKNDLFLAFGDEFVDFISEFADFFSQNDAAFTSRIVTCATSRVSIVKAMDADGASAGRNGSAWSVSSQWQEQ
jgi:hypothetical protein